MGHVSKIVSILLSKLSDCPNIDTSLCYCNYPFLTVYVILCVQVLHPVRPVSMGVRMGPVYQMSKCVMVMLIVQMALMNHLDVNVSHYIDLCTIRNSSAYNPQYKPTMRYWERRRKLVSKYHTLSNFLYKL